MFVGLYLPWTQVNLVIDFIGLVQGNKHREHLMILGKTMVSGFDVPFCQSISGLAN
jgi:hypothetical protein